jgi:hypothetical protein
VVLYGKQFESIPDDMLCKFLNLCAGGITQTERTRCELLTKCCSPTALDLFIFRLKVVCFGLRITPLLMILLNEVKLKFKTQFLLVITKKIQLANYPMQSNVEICYEWGAISLN